MKSSYKSVKMTQMFITVWLTMSILRVCHYSMFGRVCLMIVIAAFVVGRFRVGWAAQVLKSMQYLQDHAAVGFRFVGTSSGHERTI